LENTFVNCASSAKLKQIIQQFLTTSFLLFDEILIGRVYIAHMNEFVIKVVNKTGRIAIVALESFWRSDESEGGVVSDTGSGGEVQWGSYYSVVLVASFHPSYADSFQAIAPALRWQFGQFY